MLKYGRVLEPGDHLVLGTMHLTAKGSVKFVESMGLDAIRKNIAIFQPISTRDVAEDHV